MRISDWSSDVCSSDLCRSCGGCASVTAVSGCRVRKTRLVKGSTVTIPDHLPTQTGEEIKARNERHLGAMGAFVGAFRGRKLADYTRLPDADGNSRQVTVSEMMAGVSAGRSTLSKEDSGTHTTVKSG